MALSLRYSLIAVAFVLVVDSALLALLDMGNPGHVDFWWLLNWPSLLMFCVCNPLLAPPLGESEIGGWDHFMQVLSLLGSCLGWGLMGAIWGWLVKVGANETSPLLLQKTLDSETQRNPGESNSPSP
jgi:hypothetical protein